VVRAAVETIKLNISALSTAAACATGVMMNHLRDANRKWCLICARRSLTVRS
jgi:hypothetical protein